MQLLAPAKINLALHITGQRPDGYHLIDSLVAFAAIGDRLTLQADDDLQLSLSGPEAGGLKPDSDNLVIAAAELLRPQAKNPNLGASLHLQKNLPVASGIGGGSADAAATLVGLNRLWGLDLALETLQQLSLPLGADIPMCLAGIPAQIRGIGETIQPVNLPSLPIVLVNPRVAVSTPAIFNVLERKNNPPMAEISDAAISDPEALINYLAQQRNDLQLPALGNAPAIGDCLTALGSIGPCRLVRMSGSGATCFGLFDTQEQANTAARELGEEHPDWWVVATTTIASATDTMS